MRRAAACALVASLAGCTTSARDAPRAEDGGLVADADGATADAGHAPMLPGPDADTATSSRPDARTGDGGSVLDAGDAGSDHPIDSGTPPDVSPDAGADAAAAPTLEELPYARGVVSFTAGEHAGFGQAAYPAVVLGPPQGRGTSSGSLDVLSLGVGGSIVLDFGTLGIVDGAGADFVVFENAFWPGGDETQVFAELAEVSVSDDGETWESFSCDAGGDGSGVYAGCAGWTPTEDYDPFEVLPLDPALTGGDAFDLADVSLERARYVRIDDLSTTGTANNGGFDLDAVGIVHVEER